MKIHKRLFEASKPKPKIYDEILRDLQSYYPPSSGGRGTMRQVHTDSSDIMLAVMVRDWGRWENPPESYDEEDYDWQELNSKDRALAQKDFEKWVKTHKWKKYVIPRVQPEEKNWLSFELLWK